MSIAQTTFAVVDAETTGKNPATDAVVSIAVARVGPHPWTIWSTLVNPLRPIPPESTAIHGIRDEDVVGAPTFDEVVNGRGFREAMADAVPAAYNARFDSAFVPNAGRWLCVMRLAKHLLGDTVADYQLPTVAERLGVDSSEVARALPKSLRKDLRHQAPFDALLAGHALPRLTDLYLSMGLTDQSERLLDYAERPICYNRLSFGQYEELPFDRAPVSYLQWLANDSEMGRDPDIAYSARVALERQVRAGPSEGITTVRSRLRSRALSLGR